MSRRSFARVLGPVALVLAAAACSSAPVIHQEKKAGVDVSSFRTYAWHEHEHPDEGGTELLGKDYESALRAAADRALAAKGYRLDAKPQFLVNWHLSVHGLIDTARMAEYYGYGPGWQTWAGIMYPSAALPVPSDRDEDGSLVLDLLRAEDRELYWRGFLTGVIDQEADIQTRRSRIDGLVQQVLDQLPPAK